MKTLLGVSLFTAALAVSALSFPGSRGFELKRQAKPGDSARYQISASFQYQGRTATMSMEQTETVTKIENDGSFQVETNASKCKFSTDGHEQALPDSPGNQIAYDRLGALLTIHEAAPDGDAYRKANMLAFIAPDHVVSVGDKWERTFQSDPSTGMRAAKNDFEIEKSEKIGKFDTVKVKFDFTETEGNDPISSSGYAWVSTADGSVVKLDAKFKNFPMGASGRPVEGAFSMSRA